jgi:signal transduction histidine kinase/ActR/RegA family two-component response regulator
MTAGVRLYPPALRAALPFVGCYGIAIYFGVGLASPIGISAMWGASGVLAASLLLLDRRAGVICAISCAVLHLTITRMLGTPPVKALIFGPMTWVEGLAMAALVRPVCGKSLNFTDGRRLLRLLFGVVAPACIGVAVLLAANKAYGPGPRSTQMPLLWAIGHTLGAITVIPAVTAIARRRPFAAMRRPPLEFWTAMALVLAVCSILFFWSPEPARLSLVFPLMMLIAFRYGPVGAAVGSLILAMVSAWLVYAGLDTLTVPGFVGIQAKVGWMQAFVALVFLTTLPASGAVASYARMRNLLARRTSNAREARRRAERAGAAKSEFLANMSHEIRTPLNGVIGLADGLSRTEMSPPQRDMLKMILDSGKSLTGLLSDALDLARADSGALKLTAEAFDIRETNAAAAEPYEALARQKGVAFNLDFDLIPPGAAVGDSMRVRQIVANLISNAVKFTTEGSVDIEVSLLPLGGGRLALRATVRDTGQGFGPEVQARLFRRFEQGDNSVTRRYGGSGLGLSVAHRLAEMMGGRINCGSIVGEGSVFVFEVELPQAAASVGSLARIIAASDVSGAGQGRPSVLLAEDHPVNRKVIEAMLGDSVELTVVEDGLSAVEACAVRRFDVILMDTHMPVMDGLTAIRAIRADEARTAGARTPVVSLTADAMPEQVQAALAAGADLHVSKPITGDALFAALDACRRLREPEPARAIAV